MKRIVSIILIAILSFSLLPEMAPKALAAGETISNWGTTSLDTATIEKIDRVMHPNPAGNTKDVKYLGHTYRSYYSVDYEKTGYFHAQGDFYLSKEKIGLCTDYTLANLINRKLAQYDFSNFVDLEDILMVSVAGAPQDKSQYIRGKYQQGDNVYSCIYFMDSNGTHEKLDQVYHKTFEDGSSFCFKIDRGELKDRSPEYIRSVLKQELDNKPEGVWVYDGHHAFLLTYYQYDGQGKIHFGAIDSGHWGMGDLSSSKTPMEQTFAVQTYAGGDADTMIDQLDYYLVINSTISTITPPPATPVSCTGFAIGGANRVIGLQAVEVLKGTAHDVCGTISGDNITSITVSIKDHSGQQVRQTDSITYSAPTKVRNLNLVNERVNTNIKFGDLPKGCFDMCLAVTSRNRQGVVTTTNKKVTFYVVDSLMVLPGKPSINNLSINNLTGSPITIWKGAANLTGTITSATNIARVKVTIFNRKYNEYVPYSERKFIEYCNEYSPKSRPINIAASPLNCSVNGSTDYIKFGSFYRGEYALYLEVWDVNGEYAMSSIVFVVK